MTGKNRRKKRLLKLGYLKKRATPIRVAQSSPLVVNVAGNIFATSREKEEETIEKLRELIKEIEEKKEDFLAKKDIVMLLNDFVSKNNKLIQIRSK